MKSFEQQIKEQDSFEKEIMRLYPEFFDKDENGKVKPAECGIGGKEEWRGIILCLFEAMSRHAKSKNISNLRVAQVKEKFGQLRFYVDGADDSVYGMIRLAEVLCEKINK